MSPLYIGLIVAGVGLLFVVIGFVMRGKAGKIAATPLLRTGDAARATGPASSEGAARTQQPLFAPCTNTPCVFYRLTIEKKVKVTHGSQTSTKWLKMAEPHVGSVFALDDGSGPLWVQATEDVEGDLEQTFSGAPPGGQLGALANYVTAPQNPNEQILEYRVTEKLIRVDGKAFVLGAAQQGSLVKPPTGKMMVSTRGRDAMVGSAKTKSLIFLAVGGLAIAGGATVSILRPGEARACPDTIKGLVAKCAVSSTITEDERLQADGSKKKQKFRRGIVKWEVVTAGKYKLSANDPKKRDAFPTVQVENSVGIPMNVGLGLGIGAGAYSFDTTTASLSPGTYTVYVFSNENGPSSLNLEIAEAPAK